MNGAYRALATLFVLCTFAGITPAQSQLSKSEDSDRSKDQKPSQIRLFNVLRVMKFADRALAFDDLKVKVLTISQFADLLWRDDEQYARQLFVKALNACESQKGGSDTSDTKLSARGFASLRRQIVGYIARRDAKWARELIASGLFSERTAISGSQANIETAYDLARNNDPKTASEFAQQSLTTGVSPWVVGLLIELRINNPALADSLFLQVLDRMESEASPDLKTFSYLGTYLFTSPRVNPEDPTAFAQVIVGSTLLYDISLERPKISPILVRAYLQTSVSLIGRSASVGQSSLAYAVGYLLLPKASRFAPELVPILTSAMQSIASKVSPDMLDPSSYKTLETPAEISLGDALSEIERISGENKRDEKYLSLCATLWRKKDYDSARVVTRKISDLNIREQLDSIIDFGEAAARLEKSDVPKARAIAERMPKRIEKSILWVAIAKTQGDPSEAVESLNRSIEAISSLVDPRRGYVLMDAAGLMANWRAVQ